MKFANNSAELKNEMTANHLLPNIIHGNSTLNPTSAPPQRANNS